MKLATPVKRSQLKTDLLPLLGVLLLFSACRREPDPVHAPGTAIRFAHLTDLAWKDRYRTGQPTDFLPRERYDALLSDLSAHPADILVLRGIGSRPALITLRDDLSEILGHEFTATYIPDKTPYNGLGFLTRTPPVSKRSLSALTYEVEGTTHQPLAGGIRLPSSSQREIWIWNASLPEPDADYENRRNEARLLAQALRPQLEDQHAVLLSLHCREDPDSPMLRMLSDMGLTELVAQDATGDRWTHRDPEGRVYLLDQLLFASPALLDMLDDAPRIHSNADLRTAGEYRHQQLWLP